MAPPDGGIEPEEAFEILGHETRLAILNELWEASRVRESASEQDDSGGWYPGADAISFSELRKRVGMRDGSQFNYHLGKLVGRFVHRTDDGYVLGRTGQRIISLIQAEEFTEEIVFEAEPIADPCPLCGGDVVLESGTERALDFLFFRCTDCAGLRQVTGFPPGIIGIMDSLAPAGYRGRSSEEVIQAMMTWTLHRQTMALRGVCPDCTGPTDTSLIQCEDHEPTDGEICRSCQTVFGVRFFTICEICSLPWVTPSERHVLTHPTVHAFYLEHGYDPPGFDWPMIGAETIEDHTILDTDPLRIRTSIVLDEERLEVVLDEGGTVLRCERSG